MSTYWIVGALFIATSSMIAAHFVYKRHFNPLGVALVFMLANIAAAYTTVRILYG